VFPPAGDGPPDQNGEKNPQGDPHDGHHHGLGPPGVDHRPRLGLGGLLGLAEGLDNALDHRHQVIQGQTAIGLGRPEGLFPFGDLRQSRGEVVQTRRHGIDELTQTLGRNRRSETVDDLPRPGQFIGRHGRVVGVGRIKIAGRRRAAGLQRLLQAQGVLLNRRLFLGQGQLDHGHGGGVQLSPRQIRLVLAALAGIDGGHDPLEGRAIFLGRGLNHVGLIAHGAPGGELSDVGQGGLEGGQFILRLGQGKLGLLDDIVENNAVQTLAPLGKTACFHGVPTGGHDLIKLLVDGPDRSHELDSQHRDHQKNDEETQGNPLDDLEAGGKVMGDDGFTHFANPLTGAGKARGD
jgi:hypothetical protein